MQPTFHIEASNIDLSLAHLVLEAGPQGISIVVIDGKNCFVSVIIYSFPSATGIPEYITHLEEIIKAEKLLEGAYSKTDIIWAFPESILVPPDHHDATISGDMLDLVFGDLEKTTTRNDFLFRHNLHNIYRVPSVISDAFAQRFPLAGQTHQFSLLADRVEQPGNHLLAVFYSNSLTVLLRKAGQLQVIRNFNYQAPDDAAWCLLNICSRFEVEPNDTVLHLSGMIDTGSALYAEVNKYFLHIDMGGLPEKAEYAEQIIKQPAHYFSHLFASVLCV